MDGVVGWVRGLRIRTEPLILLLAACNTARSICSPSLAEAKMRRVYTPPPDIHGKELDKFFNKKMVEWDNYYEYVNLPTACILGIIYGGYSDHYGRKLPLLIGIASVLLENAFRMLIWSEQTDWPLEWLFPLAAICGLLGDFTLTMSCVNAYVTDQFPNKTKLSFRMIVVSIVFSLGSLMGSQVTNALLSIIGRIAILGLVQGGYAVSFLIGSVTLDENQQQQRQQLMPEGGEEEVGGGGGGGEETDGVAEDSAEPPIRLSHKERMAQSFRSFYDSFKIFSLPRAGHRRLFLHLCFAANFLDQLVFGEEKSLIGTYTRLAPFHWDSHQYARYKGLRPIIQICGMVFGLFVLKRVLNLRDTLLICFAIASMGACVVAIGLAHDSWIIFASLVPGSLHGLLNPLTYSFMSCLIEPREIGKAYAISSIAQKLAGFAQTAVLQNIYIVTVDWYQGFVWLLMGFVSFVAVGIYACVHFIAKRENIGS